ncbi:N-acetylglucosaminyl-phosphatidylinositol de-N-acetylase isoform X2 [Hyperolius riggenbachi]|uniref:N-acetylglucosaminyl-phosphatidylinositol de-N-acetylase isoform X2 n=1 Tax=Hyperolius riggenbachi TaxID=752182 RepID=UPI0035A2C651
MLLVAVASAVLVFGCVWGLCSRWRHELAGRAVGLLRGVRAPLLLIAHPDDECMFFAPTILGLLQEQRPLSVLCCSTGNYYNQGEIRKREFFQSCAALGIPPSKVAIIDHRDLPDNPGVQWDQQLLSDLLLNHIKENHIDLVITFDAGGVSGHSNHISLYNAVRYLHHSKQFPEGCSVLLLESVNIFRKYLSVLDLPISWFLHPDILFVSSEVQNRQAKIHPGGSDLKMIVR